MKIVIIVLLIIGALALFVGSEMYEKQTIPIDITNPNGNVLDRAPDDMFALQGDCACRATRDSNQYDWAYLYTKTNQTTRGTASVDQCKAMCALQKNCVGFTYDKEEKGCWLIQSPGYLFTDTKVDCGKNQCWRKRLSGGVPVGAKPQSFSVADGNTNKKK